MLNNYISYNNSVFNKYIIITSVLVVFYPLKGLLNLTYYFFQYESIPGVFNKFVFIILLLSLSTLFLCNKFKIKKYWLHTFFTVTAITMSLISNDRTLLYQIFLLLVLPILFSIFDDLPPKYGEKIIKSFFKFTLIYMLIEYILLNIKIEGGYLISPDLYQSFYSLISPGGLTIDHRHRGSWQIVRSGGFLADPLAMSALVVMSSTYFYINYRLYKRNIFYTLIGIFLVISGISVTAIATLAFTTLVFEIHHNKLWKAIITTTVLFYLVTLHPTFDYVYYRTTEHVIFNSGYWIRFFNFDFMYELKTYLYLILGCWNWYGCGADSHVDLLLIPLSMGIIGFYILYKIFLKGFIFYRSKKSIFTIYSYILLSAFVCLYHHAMTLSLNIMIIVVFVSGQIKIPPRADIALLKQSKI